ncbi:MAG: hypothetical protein IJV97_02110 [Alphaproteobacteria bacterium]|nr:hypothetical protein [Alphaproteobacteria bacterium]
MQVYCDSSFDEKRQIAGIGITIIDGQKRRTFSNWIKARTNNEGELFAIYLASILSEGKGIIYTDSQVAMSYVDNGIKDKPRTKEQFINHKCCEYWAYKIRKQNVILEKIKAHQKVFQLHPMGNRMADLLANEGRAKFYERDR